MSNVPDSIVAKIKKLLALANDARGNENEMNVAAERAQSLMAEYNLSLSSIDSDGSDRKKDITNLSATRDWQVNLMQALAKNNFCVHWTEFQLSKRPDGTGKLRNRRKHMLIGREVNIFVVKSMYDYLISAMESYCPYEDRRDRSANSWFTGCTDRLVIRLGDLRTKAEAESRTHQGSAQRGNGSDLVLSDVYSTEEDLNTDVLYGRPPGTTARLRAEREARQREADEAWAVALKNQPPTTYVAPKEKEETEAQRLKREKKEAEANARWWKAYQKRQEREEAKVDRRAYFQGSATGGEIGLDKQVTGKDSVAKLK